MTWSGIGSRVHFLPLTIPNCVRGRATRRRLQVLALSAFLTGAASYGLADAPIGKVEVLALLAGGTPAAELAERVERDGLSFQPTESFLKLVASAEAQNDPGKEKLAKALAASRVAGASETESPKESSIVERLARGAELLAKTAPAGQQDLRAAEQEFRQAVNADPGEPSLHFALGNALALEGNFDGAITELRNVVTLMPDLGAAHLNLGRALASKGEIANAVEEFRAAVRLNPDFTPARNFLARALLVSHDPQGAVEVLREGLRVQPENPTMHNGLGTALLAAGDAEGAIGEFRQAIHLGSKDPELYMDLAFALRKQGDLDGAIAQIREAIRLNPTSYRYHYNLGEALSDKGELSSAKEEFRRTIRLNSAYALAHSELGYVLRKQKDLDGAIDEYRTAIRLDPDLAVAHMNLAAALEAKGEHVEAYQEAKLGRQLASENPAAARQLDDWAVSNEPRRPHPPAGLEPQPSLLNEPNQTDLLYYADSQIPQFLPLEAENMTILADKGTFGRMKASVMVSGEKSSVRVKAGSALDFVIRPSGGDGSLTFTFLRFETEKGKRMLRLKKDLEPSNSADKPGRLAFDVSRLGTSSFRLTVPYRLEPGEYGFIVTAAGKWVRIFCFGVDSP
jgi:tetratricopeptide (TPR) repeat protein